jgi:flagellar P-ring protein precursor FlgI
MPAPVLRWPVSVPAWPLATRAVLAVLLLFASGTAAAQRLKDLAQVAGVRGNQLLGYGLVVGLDGTGDQTTQTPFTVQAFRNMLREFGIQLPEGTALQLKNVAAVTVHAELPPFARPGQLVDVTVSSVGNAKSLRGGTLLVTPLKGIDGAVYGIAQGNLVVGGFGAEGQDGSRITVNVPSAGRIPGGATVERPSPATFGDADSLVFLLHRGDFTTARRVADAINGALGGGVAAALDAGSVRVTAPADPAARVAFVSVLENLELTAGEAPARVIINSRTGTIVIGEHVSVRPAAVTHGSLTVTISERLAVSQPNPLADGDTAVVPQSDVDAEQARHRMFRFPAGVSLEEIVAAVNEVGAAPGDLMAILEALRQAGALSAEIVVI